MWISMVPWWLRGKKKKKKSAYQCRSHRRPGFSPWVRKIPWRRKWQSIAMILAGKTPWTEEPGDLRFIGSQRVGHD